MTYHRIVGDIHGDFNTYEYLLRDGNGHSIQVGDFGIGFAGPYWHDKVDDYHTANPNSKFIRGNHDHPIKSKKMIGYIQDGTVVNETMFIGGAWSIDNPTDVPGWRTEGVNWWFDEELSMQEFDIMIDIYATIKPKVMITHDAPLSATWEMFCKEKGFQKKSRTGQALQAMYEIHQPDYWFFGHWHATKSMKLGNTHFQCIGINDYIDFDLEKLEFKL